MRLLRTVGRYEILREIGRGGMSVVYLARQTDLDRFVALKELGPGFAASDPAMSQRFLRESRLAGSLSHPNIVTVYEYFEHDGTPLIAMEFHERGSLRRYMGQLSLAQIGTTLEGLLGALAHAERQGIVHRDVKPENLLVTVDGRVKLGDFGIAKATSGLQTGAFVTAMGTTVGTPAYMAPEQAMAQDVGPWTDLYSVGCMAFELFTGHVPFHDSDAPMAILLRHINEPIPAVHSLEPDVDPRISEWVERLVAKAPADRPSAAAAWDAFEEILTELVGTFWRREAVLPNAPPVFAQPSDGASNGSATFDAGAEERAESPAAFDTFVGPWEPPPEVHTPPPFTPPPQAAPPLPSGPPTQTWDVPATPPPPPPPIPPQPPEFTPPAFSVRDHRAPPFTVPLTQEFQYLHGPLLHDESSVPLLGNAAIVEALKERLVHSRGGSFLITGFRGVGKTTVVLRALEELEAGGGGVEYLPVVLSVARPLTVDQLLFEVVRRLFEALTDRGVLESLEPNIREALVLAYVRTSLAFKETSSRARESSQSLSVDLGRLGPAAVIAPQLGVSRKRTDSLAREASFLAYSHADVEHDFLRILDLLNNPAATAPRRGVWPFRRPQPAPWRGRLVVVLDELDKLTGTPEGVEAVDQLLMGLKNLLTARHVHFVFVGGPELHDAFMRDVARGNSVYESVFACHMYVPCLWETSRHLLDTLVEADVDRETPLTSLVRYFDFKARGVPRLLLRELNALVRWQDGIPAIDVGGVDAARVAFYATIQEVITEFVDTAIDRELLSMPIDEDRWRFSAYYVTDWILRRGTAAFTVADILAEHATPNALVHASPERVERLVTHLVAHRMVEELWSPGSHQTMVADAAQPSVYRLAPAVLSQLASFARRNEMERAELRGAGGEEPAARVKSGRYELGDLVGVGGVGRVYRALDRRLNREVAIKILAPHLVRDESASGRWRREAEIAMQLKHPHIVRTYDVIDEPPETVGIVMELIDGPSLRAVLPLQLPSAVAVADQLLSALVHAESFGLARFDIKPENIVFAGAARAVIVDLGLVKRTVRSSDEFNTFATMAGGLLIGTPAYMSPEQVRGGPLDIRSDLYCVALVLYETIVGRHVRGDIRSGAMDLAMQMLAEPPDLAELDVSDRLRGVLERAFKLDPDDRFGSPAEMQLALQDTPEGIAGRALAEHELLVRRDARPARGRLAVMPAIGAPGAPQPTDA